VGDMFLSLNILGDDDRGQPRDEVDDNQNDDDDSDLSGLSSGEEFEEVSEAASRVGQKALTDLLSAAGAKKRSPNNKKPQPGSGKPKARREKQESESSNDESGEEATADYSVAESRVGRTALQGLLAAAVGKTDSSSRPIGKVTQAEARRGISKPSRKRKQSPKKNESPSPSRRSPRPSKQKEGSKRDHDDSKIESLGGSDDKSNSTSVASSRVGRAALENLFLAAGKGRNARGANSDGSYSE